MKSNPQFSAPHLTSNQLLLQCLGPLSIGLYLFYMYLGIRAIWGKLDPNNPNHVQRHIKSNPELSASHSTWNEVLLKCQGNLRIELYLFQCICGTRAIWKNFALVLYFCKKLSNLTCRALNFASRMGFSNSFSQAVQEIKKINFENSEFRDFVPTLCNFIQTA